MEKKKGRRRRVHPLLTDTRQIAKPRWKEKEERERKEENKRTIADSVRYRQPRHVVRYSPAILSYKPHPATYDFCGSIS